MNDRASGRLAEGRVGAAQLKPVAHHWRWAEIAPYLDRIAEIARGADVSPIEFAERQQFLLTNPGLGGRLQVTSTMRCAVSIYNPGDVAPVHIHTPNASRTILLGAVIVGRNQIKRTRTLRLYSQPPVKFQR